jgi:GNAT superfamily N-acetyltransferase
VKIEPKLQTTAIPFPAQYDRDSEEVSFSEDPATAIKGKNVIVMDSSIHSGITMRRVVEAISKFGASKICSYTLVLKQSASFIPSFWGVTIGDYDRAYFMLNCLPNNHFHDALCGHGQVRERPPQRKDGKTRNPYFHIRKLSRSDLGRPTIVSGLDSLDRTQWEDRYYEMTSHPSRTTYVLEASNEIVGYLTVDRGSDFSFSIEAVAVRRDRQGLGYGPALLRWGETIARQSDFRRITLWAINEKVEFYKSKRYRVIPDVAPMQLGTETYTHMTKPVLAHLGQSEPVRAEATPNAAAGT